MIGFGFQDLAIIGTAVDIYHPDVIRASMGAFFQLRFQGFEDFSNYQEAFPRNFYPLMTDGAFPLPEAKIQPPFGLIFGPESEGLPPKYHQYGRSIRIPQNKQIDSLNVAIAVGVTIYHTFTHNKFRLSE
jgi:TrmH family RNA methyltransferase